MSFPDPTPPHSALTSPPMGGDGLGFWSPFMIGPDQHQHQTQNMDSNSIPIHQFDHHYQHPNNNPNQMQNLNPNNPPFKRLRQSERSPIYPQMMNPRTTNPPTIPGGNRGTSHIFFKTRICAKFMDGTCRNGDQCTFAHGPEDLREPPPNWQELIREKERGAGTGPWACDEQRSMIHMMKICKKYFNGEECPYGEKCNFLHERPLQPVLKKFKADNAPGLAPGMGMMGHRDRESAVISIGTVGDHRGSGEQGTFWKTKVCSKWEMGQCPYGDRCHFAHGHADLKIVDEADIVASGVPRKAAPFVQHNPAPVQPSAVGGVAAADGEEENKSLSKWKLTRKVNRIYADWLDDMSPPRCVPNEEEV